MLGWEWSAVGAISLGQNESDAVACRGGMGPRIWGRDGRMSKESFREMLNSLK